MLSVNQGGIKYHFLSLWYDDLGLNPGLPDHWWTLYSLVVALKKKENYEEENENEWEERRLYCSEKADADTLYTVKKKIEKNNLKMPYLETKKIT